MHEAICPFCGTVVRRLLTDKLRRGEGKVFHCLGCDLGFLIAVPVAEDHYAARYRKTASHHADGSATSPAETFEACKHFQESRIEAVKPRLAADVSVLEFGASAGQFLWHLHGVNRRCAVEPDTESREFLTEMGIESAANADAFAGQQFDIVCAFQVMEHLQDPVEFLRLVRSFMKPGGVAFIEVPNLYDPLLSVWGIPEYVPFYFHADHRFYFTAKSLRCAAEKAGFKTDSDSVWFTQDYNLLNHLHWIMNRAPQPTSEIGLGPVKVEGASAEISVWLSTWLAALNSQYVGKLKEAGATSNLMLRLDF